MNQYHPRRQLDLLALAEGRDRTNQIKSSIEHRSRKPSQAVTTHAWRAGSSERVLDIVAG
jgi:hypothetical protein